MPLAGQDLDGHAVDLARLRGKVVVVAFGASWERGSRKQVTTFDALSRALGDGLAIVRVDSDEDLASARQGTAGARFITVFDRAEGHCSPIGALAHRWGVDALPETFLVDSAGNLRFHFVNDRDWASADAIGCVRALAADPMPVIATAPVGASAPTPICVDAPVSPDAVIRGTITFADAKGLRPGTAIFVVAKPEAGGSPIAIDKLTYRGGDVPFELDQTKTMIAGTPFGGAVVVTARYDQDGDALSKQPGDRYGEVHVAVPATGVKLVLDRVVGR